MASMLPELEDLIEHSIIIRLRPCSKSWSKSSADMGRYSVFVVVESEGDRRIGGGALSRGKWILVAVEVSPVSLSNATFTDPRTAVLETSTITQ